MSTVVIILFKLIPDLRQWLNRKHGLASFHLTQFLTGHGCFRTYLKRFHRSDTDLCLICGQAVDDAEHAVLKCNAWESWRREACLYLEVAQLDSSNIVAIMLALNYNWSMITGLVERILKLREAEEQLRQKTSDLATR